MRVGSAFYLHDLSLSVNAKTSECGPQTTDISLSQELLGVQMVELHPGPPELKGGNGSCHGSRIAGWRKYQM